MSLDKRPEKFGLIIVVTSDTHLNKPTLPEGDILIHAGDLTNTGTLEQMMLMNNWLASVASRFKHIIYVPGNHDWLPYKNQTLADATMSAVTILHDKELVIDGCTFYGSSWQPQFMQWAYNRSEDDLAEKYAHIPYSTDVLITHCPPFGILDQSTSKGQHLGSTELAIAVERVKPRLHIFGHIHGSYGIATVDETTYCNGACCDEQYRPVNKPIVLEI